MSDIFETAGSKWRLKFIGLDEILYDLYAILAKTGRSGLIFGVEYLNYPETHMDLNFLNVFEESKRVNEE